MVSRAMDSARSVPFSKGKDLAIMKKMLMMACAAAGLMAVAEPQVSNVTVTKDARSRKVTIAYDLNEDAIVTAEILVRVKST